VFAILITKEKEDGQVGGLVPHLVDGGVSILQYVDHTIFYMKHDLEKEINIKLILCIFEQLLGLKIIFHKSKIFYFGKEKNNETEYRKKSGCESGLLPFRYLGIPIHNRQLRNSEWNPVESHSQGKLRLLSG
jgi:hypothetical protein